MNLYMVVGFNLLISKIIIYFFALEILMSILNLCVTMVVKVEGAKELGVNWTPSLIKCEKL